MQLFVSMLTGAVQEWVVAPGIVTMNRANGGEMPCV